jgi:hypothetical protein
LSFDRILEECRIFLSLQETDLERWEEKPMEVQACGLHPFDGWDLSVRLEELHVHLAEVEDERVTEALELLRLVMEISDALVDLGGASYPRRPPTSKISAGGFGGGRSHFGAPTRGICLWCQFLGLNLVRPSFS